jgi:hypothetical protein
MVRACAREESNEGGNRMSARVPDHELVCDTTNTLCSGERQNKKRVYAKARMLHHQEEENASSKDASSKDASSDDNGMWQITIASCLAVTYRWAADVGRRFRWWNGGSFLSNTATSGDTTSNNDNDGMLQIIVASCLATTHRWAAAIVWLRDRSGTSSVLKALAVYVAYRIFCLYYRKPAGGPHRSSSLVLVQIADDHYAIRMRGMALRQFGNNGHSSNKALWIFGRGRQQNWSAHGGAAW